MGLLKKAMNTQAYLKMGGLGFTASGKTYTACMLAIGIAKRLGNNKPVAFFDTETGSDFLIDKFKAEDIEFYQVKSQSFYELLTAAKEAEQMGVACFVVDSISHVWRDLIESYRKKHNLRFIQIHHWADIKREWAAWTQLYLNSKMHIIVLGRAGYDFDEEKDEDGKKSLIKVGTKMKVESEFGFEPSLLIEMERVSKSAEPGSGWIHRAHILKDRTDTINGKAFDFEKPRAKYKVGDWARVFKPFQPVFDHLNIGGEHIGVPESDATEQMLKSPESRNDWHKRRAIALEEIQASLIAIWPGQDAGSKAAKIAVLEALFNTRAWAAVENLSAENLEGAYRFLREREDALREVTAETPAEMSNAVKAALNAKNSEVGEQQNLVS